MVKIHIAGRRKYHILRLEASFGYSSRDPFVLSYKVLRIMFSMLVSQVSTGPYAITTSEKLTISCSGLNIPKISVCFPF